MLINKKDNLIQQKPIEQQIKEKIGQFELLALHRLLHHLGYRQIWYQSCDRLVSEPQVIDDIDFTEHKTEHSTANKPLVKLTLNIGLLGPQSPLPSYFMKIRETLIQKDEEFKQFIGFFDHILIDNLLKQLFPELAQFGGISWLTQQKNSLLLTNLKAIRNIQMIFAAIFPEYQVKCYWQQQRQSRLKQMPLGSFTLGTPQSLGGVYFHQQGIVRVCLTRGCDSFHMSGLDTTGLDITELQQRLHQLVLPLFAPLSLPLEVFLQGILQPLHLSESSQGFQQMTPLGYHPLLSASQAGQQLLFAGNTYKSAEQEGKQERKYTVEHQSQKNQSEKSHAR